MSEQQPTPGTSPTPATPPPPAATPTPATPPPAPGPDVWGNLKKLPLSEKFVFVLALLVELGWIIAWCQTNGWAEHGLQHWFPLLSFFGALAIVVMVVLKLLAIRFLPGNMEKYAVPIASLVPVLGLLVEYVSAVDSFLTHVGSLAMAYISATTYWRKHMPNLAEEERKPPAP